MSFPSNLNLPPFAFPPPPTPRQGDVSPSHGPEPKPITLKRARPLIVGDISPDQVMQARLDAVNALAVVANRYNGDCVTCEEDIADYNDCINLWEQRKAAMTPQDYNATFNFLTLAQAAGSNEVVQLQNAFAHISAGNQDVLNGDAQTTPDAQYQYYLLGSSSAADATPCCGSAESYHATYAQNAQAARAILERYG